MSYLKNGPDNEYYSVGAKFPPVTVPHVLYTVKKIINNFMFLFLLIFVDENNRKRLVN